VDEESCRSERDQSEQNNQHEQPQPHNHNEPRPDERLFACILKRALLHREDERINTAQHRSTIPDHSGVPDHYPSMDRSGSGRSALIARRWDHDSNNN